MKPLLHIWNRIYTTRDIFGRPLRRDTIRFVIRQRSTFNPTGKGNKAWKRLAAIQRDPTLHFWP